MLEIPPAPVRQADYTHNVRIYLASSLLLSLTAAFGDATVLLPSLALRLDAPSWLVTLPLVVQMCVAYLPVLYLGWRMRADWSRKRIYSISCIATSLTLVLLIVPLMAGASRNLLLVALVVSWLLFALIQGVGILPWWDLFARLFPPAYRGRMLGMSNVIGQVVTVIAAGAAAWLISARSPLAYPQSYAAALAIYVGGGIVYALFILRLREPSPDPAVLAVAEPRPSLREYCAELRDTVSCDQAFAHTLMASMVGATVMAVAPLFLAFAQKHQGFSAEATNALVFLRPLAVIPVALVAGYASHRIRPHFVVAGIALAMLLGAGVAPWLQGRWQFLTLLLTGLSPLTYHFGLVSIMSHAPTERTQHYLTIYYMGAIIPGTAPLIMGYLLDRMPIAAWAIAFTLMTATSFLFWRAGRYAVQSRHL